MQQLMTKVTLWAMLAVLLIGFVAGRAWTPVGTWATTADGTPVTGATATREVELQELEALRTQVAQSATPCAQTPTPSPSPTPAPPAAQGTPLPYGENWTIAVKGAATATNVLDSVPKGVFVLVNLTITNNELAGRFLEYQDFRLRDAQGRVFVSQPFVSSRVQTDHPINFKFDPNLPTETVVVFDVALDAGQSFILESTADPAFREQVDLEMRG
ncbi:MAG: hypothetical protein ACJ789_19225 [Thermomicrobiales bacterium]